MVRLPVILLDDSGELGNRLVTYCYLLAWSRTLQVPALNCCFWRYRAYFSTAPKILSEPGAGPREQRGRGLTAHSEGCRWCGIPGMGRLHAKFVFDGSSLWSPRIILERVIGYALRQVFGFTLARRALSRWYDVRIIVIDGHRMTLAIPRSVDPGCFTRLDLSDWTESLRSYWRLRPEYLAMAEPVRTACPSGGRMVGIHVRRGDYAKYRNGKWLFTDEMYLRFARQLVSADEGRASIVFVSNAPLGASLLDMPGSIAGPDHVLGDLCALGACDMIAGPPSTFSGAASFLFNKPVYWMEHEDQSPDFSRPARAWVPQWY
jgi:hypothetical protein